MDRRNFLTGIVAAVTGTELVLKASAQEIAQFGQGSAVVAAEHSAHGRPVPFDLSNPILYNSRGQAVAVVQDIGIQPAQGSGEQVLVLVAVGAVPVNFGNALRPIGSVDEYRLVRLDGAPTILGPR